MNDLDIKVEEIFGDYFLDAEITGKHKEEGGPIWHFPGFYYILSGGKTIATLDLSLDEPRLDLYDPDFSWNVEMASRALEEKVQQKIILETVHPTIKNQPN